MKIIKITIVLAILFSTITLLNRINSIQLKSNTGELSPYFKNRIWNKGIYFREWHGDGLGGSYHYTKLNIDPKEPFHVLDSSVLNNGESMKIAIGNQLNHYFFGPTQLPFNPMNGYWKEGFSLYGDDLMMITKNDVYLFSDNSFDKIENADANLFIRINDSTEIKFSDGKNIYEVVYHEVTQKDGRIKLKASIKTKPVN